MDPKVVKLQDAETGEVYEGMVRELVPSAGGRKQRVLHVTFGRDTAAGSAVCLRARDVRAVLRGEAPPGF
jgi:hypothetical protein